MRSCWTSACRSLFVIHFPATTFTAPNGRVQGDEERTLLRVAEEGGYDVLLTTDQGIPHQQSLTDRRISVLVLCAATNKIDDLVPLVSSVQAELARLPSGCIVFVR